MSEQPPTEPEALAPDTGAPSAQASSAEPLDVDGVNAVIVGTVLWVAGLVYCLARMDALRDQGRSWLLWTCLAGVALGLLGLIFTMRRRAAYRAARAGHSPRDHSGDHSGDHSV